MTNRARNTVIAACAVGLLVGLAWLVRDALDERGVAVTVSVGAAPSAASAGEPTLAFGASGVEETLDAVGARRSAEPAPLPPTPCPPTTVIGRVVGPDGRPIVGARVRRGTEEELGRARLDQRASFELGARGLTTPTDLDGRFVLVSVPADGEVLIVGPEHPDFVAELAWTIAKPGAECRLAMDSVFSADLIVAAVDSRTGDGIRAFDAVVTPLDRNGTPQTQVTRVRGFNGSAGATLRVARGTSVEVALLVPAMAIGRTASTVRIVTPVEGDGVTARFEFDLFAEPITVGALVVNGIVVDRVTGTPIADATVAAMADSGAEDLADLQFVAGNAGSSDLDHSVRWTSSDRRGRFRVVLATDETQLHVGSSAHAMRIVRARAGADLRVELERGAGLVVRIRDCNGAPVSGRRVKVRELGSAGVPFDFDDDWRTDEQGIVTRADLRTARYEILVPTNAMADALPALGYGPDGDIAEIGSPVIDRVRALAREVALECGKTVEVDFVVDS